MYIQVISQIANSIQINSIKKKNTHLYENLVAMLALCI